MLGDLFEIEYRLDHLCHVTLDYVFHSMSLACFLPRVLCSHFLARHTPSLCFHSLDTLGYVHRSYFFTLYAYHGLSTSSFVWSLVQFSTRCSYFHYEKVKDTFSHPYFFESCLDHLTIFSLMELESKFELKIYVYWWSTDLMIVCFSHLFYLELLIRIL